MRSPAGRSQTSKKSGASWGRAPKPSNYELLVLGKDGLVTERKFYEEAGGSDVLMAHHKSTYDEMHRLWKEEDALIDSSYGARLEPAT